MSVLIKGMEMTKCCVECEWHEYYGGDYDWVHACRRTGTMPIENAETERANDCPLVEVPEPHGDLIDRDALENAGHYEVYFFKGKTTKVCFVTDNYLDEFTAVIEAEGRTDGKNLSE